MIYFEIEPHSYAHIAAYWATQDQKKVNNPARRASKLYDALSQGKRLTGLPMKTAMLNWQLFPHLRTEQDLGSDMGF